MSSNTGLFDDLVETAETVPAEQPAAEAETAPAAEAKPASKRGAKKLPDPERERLDVDNAEEIPAGYVTVKQFAFHLTQRNFQSAIENGRTPTEDDLVSEQAVYVATTAKRHTLPSALLHVNGEAVRGGVVIPLERGVAAWDGRPERGTGAAGLTDEQIESRVLRAGKAKARLVKLEAQVKRYGELLAEVDKTWDDANAAYEEWLSENEEEIPDNAE